MAQYSKTNLIVNYLPQKLRDEEFRSLFSCVAPVKRAKVCRDKRSGYSFGFGFCEFYRPDDATKAIQTLNGHRLHNKTLKVAYARLQSAESKNCCLHLTNLPVRVTAEDIRRILAPFGGIISCKILADNQGCSRGIGFCLFETHTSASQAMDDMNQKPWPDTTEPPIHIRFAHPNEKKVRAPSQQQQQQQQAQQQQQTYLMQQQHHYQLQQHQQVQMMHQQQQHQAVLCCPDQQQHNQHQQLLLQPQQMWGCCQQGPMLSPYPCPHPLMRATLAYPMPGSMLLPPPPQLLPPAPPPQPYLEFRVCATNLSSALDDIQLYGLFAQFGGILEFLIARPGASELAAATTAAAIASATAGSSFAAATSTAASASASGYSSAEDASSIDEAGGDGGGGEGGGGGCGEETSQQQQQQKRHLEQSQEDADRPPPPDQPQSQPQPAQQQPQLLPISTPSESQDRHQHQQLSVAVYVTYNNYQSAASVVYSLNGQFVNGQQVQVAMRIEEQPPMLPEGVDLGVHAYQ